MKLYKILSLIQNQLPPELIIQIHEEMRKLFFQDRKIQLQQTLKIHNPLLFTSNQKLKILLAICDYHEIYPTNVFQNNYTAYINYRHFIDHGFMLYEPFDVEYSCCYKLQPIYYYFEGSEYKSFFDTPHTTHIYCSACHRWTNF
jgi:hypothetical protein